MYLEVEENPNCAGTPLQVFEDLSPPRKVLQMKLSMGEERVLYWVTGVDQEGVFVPAYAQKVSDSGGGVSLLVYGGSWGIRFKPVGYGDEPWDLSNPNQWGEPYKFYGDEKDLIFEG